MKKTLVLFLTVCLLAVPIAFASAEDVTDLSSLNDEQLVALLAEVQNEIVARHIEKTASLPAGTYIGGRDIPIGSYVLTAAGTEVDYGIVSLRSVNDPAEDYPSKLYEFKHGDDRYSVFIRIEEGDTLILPFPYTLTISSGVLFQ